MKRIITLLGFTAVFFLSFSAWGADVDLGLRSYYEFSEPASGSGKVSQHDEQGDKIMPKGPKYKDFRYFSIGPEMNVRFNREWFISSFMVTGEGSSSIDKRSPVMINTTGKLNLINGPLDMKSWRWDSTVGYQPVRYLRFTAGIRYLRMNFNSTLIGYESNPNSIFFKGFDQLLGPRIGVIGRIPLGRRIWLEDDFNVSHLWGKQRLYNMITLPNLSTGALVMPYYPKGKYRTLGWENQIRLSYRINPVILTLGFNYSVADYFQRRCQMSLNSYSGQKNRSYGPVVSAAYRFPVGMRIERDRPEPGRIWIPSPEYPDIKK